MKQRIEKWWDSFVSLKWWVQAIIIAVIAVGIHNYILHQEVICQKVLEHMEVKQADRL